MGDLTRLGERLRAELGAPPTDWTESQNARLRGLELTPPARRKRPLIAAAALAVVAALAVGLSSLRTPSVPTEAAGPPASPAEPKSTPPSESETTAVWLGAESGATTHRLDDGSSIELASGARGRLDEGAGFGTRFDLHDGAATFRVRKRNGRAFAVVAGGYRVLVVGTEFVVSYRPPRALAVTVTEGTVNVRLPDRPEPVRVQAGELLDASGSEFSVRRHDEDESAQGVPPGDGEPSTAEGTGAPTPLARWHELYRGGKYQQACREVSHRPMAYWQKHLAPDGLIDLSATLRLCSNLGGALSVLQTLRQRFPGSSEARDALFLVGRIHADQGKSRAAVLHLEQYLGEGGSPRFAAQALGRLIELHTAQHNTAKAKQFAQRYLRTTPEGPYRRLAESVVAGP